MLSAADLDIERLGSGPTVVLVHGSIVGAERSWHKQRVLADQWSLCLPNRPGFGASPGLERGDFQQEAPMIAELLGESSHLVGHSYGAVIALLAAALRPEAVRSLIVSEPGLLRLAAGDPVADAMIARGEDMYRRAPEATPRDFLLAFRSGVHSAHETPDQLPDWLERGAKTRRPGTALLARGGAAAGALPEAWRPFPRVRGAVRPPGTATRRGGAHDHLRPRAHNSSHR